MQTLLFRADSSSIIGTGHLMRDLVLAEQFKDARIIFAVQNLPGNINHKVQEKNYILDILHSNALHEVISLIHKYGVDMVVIDHYGINFDYEKELKTKTGVKIFVLDDTYEKHCCDILLNHNVYGDAKKYVGLVPENCELRCGAEHTLLRDEFVQEKKKDPGNKEGKVFIAMGGADHSNINIPILKVLASFPHLHAHLLTTTANAHLAELKAYIQDKANITLHLNSDQVAKLMHEADFAIITPSVTLNEVIYMQLPFIAVKTAENQNYMYEYLLQNGHPVLREFDAAKLKNKIATLNGLTNIELVNFTDLSLDEKKMVLKWRNDPHIRKWMFTHNEILLEEHLSYIEFLKTSSQKLYFLVRQGKENIGVIDFTRIDPESRSADFGLYANPALRGMGTVLMDTIIAYAFRILNLDTLGCEVFEANAAALKLYKRYHLTPLRSELLNEKNLIRMELKNENS